MKTTKSGYKRPTFLMWVLSATCSVNTSMCTFDKCLFCLFFFLFLCFFFFFFFFLSFVFVFCLCLFFSVRTEQQDARTFTWNRPKSESLQLSFSWAPTETVRFMLDLLPMQTRQEVKQVKAYCSAVENPHNPFHEAVTDTKECRWMQMDALRLGRGQS